MKNLKIRHRLFVGFGSLVFLLAVSIALTLLQVRDVRENTDRIVDLRVPTALASSNMAKDIYATLAALRGWMLTGDPQFKIERTGIWAELTHVKAEMDALSKNWTNSENIKKWKNFTGTLKELSAAQDRVEAIAHTPNERPATKILVSEAAPRAAKMLQLIGAMIDMEISGNGSKKADVGADNKKMLGLMADVRGTLGGSLASIRAYLLTGEMQFRNDYTDQWAINEARFTALSGLASRMSPAQHAAFDTFKTWRAEFSPLPLKMIEIRGSDQWNMATYRLVTEALPRANRLLALLLGAEQEDGTYLEGIVENQKALLKDDARDQAKIVEGLFAMQWGLLLVGGTIGLLITFSIARSISTSINSMTTAMGSLADGDLETAIPAQDREDEIGGMAKAVQIFKQNAIERDRLQQEQFKTMRELDFQKYAMDAHAIVSIGDVRGRIIYANDKFVEVSGYSRAELIGENHSIIKSGEHPPEFYADMWKMISSGNVWHGELKNRAKGGHSYWVMTTIVPSLDDRGKPFQYVSIRTDITERKDAEIKALMASRTKSSLIANMSHELRTPLNAIIGFSGIIKEETFGPIGNEKYNDYVDDIHHSGQHLLEIINDILDVSAVEAGALELNEANVSLPKIIESSIRILSPRAVEAKVIVTSSVDPQTPLLYLDERRAKQIFINLLSNAVKFTPEGGEVSVDSYLNDDGSLAVTVTDTGMGMDDEELLLALSAFGQADSGLDRKHEGTGLGLPLTVGLMELHGGTLHLKSKKGQGTLVTLTFPKERML